MESFLDLDPHPHCPKNKTFWRFQFTFKAYFSLQNFGFETPQSTVAQKCHGNFNFVHGNFNFVHGNFNFITAISISPRQFQLRSRQFQFHHGNFNFTTAISTSFTAISTSSRQFQFHHGNFNFTTAISTSFTAISILSRQFQLCSRQFQFYHRNFFINSDRPVRLSRACFSRF